MEATNGTDEGVLRGWLERERDQWVRAFVATLDEAVQQLQTACFELHWQDLISQGADEEAAGRSSLEMYSDGLTSIYRFVRACGTLTDAVAWSRLKNEHRDLAGRSDVDTAIIQALEDGLYAAEAMPLGNHSLYRSWAGALMFFLFQWVAEGPPWPGIAADDESKLAWGYDALKEIEDHRIFQEALAGYMRENGVRHVMQALLDDTIDAVIEHSERMSEMERFDLIMSTGLRWVVGAVERG